MLPSFGFAAILGLAAPSRRNQVQELGKRASSAADDLNETLQEIADSKQNPLHELVERAMGPDVFGSGPKQIDRRRTPRD